MSAEPIVWTNSPSVLTRLRQLYARRETILYLVSSNLKAGHRNKALGNLWSLLDPLLSLAVYYVVFGILFRQAAAGVGNYLVYLFVGVVAWRFLDGTISQAVNCIRGNRGLIAEINFPKAVFPLSIAFSRLYDLLWGLVVLFAALLISGTHLSWYVVWLVPLIFIQLMLVVGASYIAAYLGAFFADTANISNVVLRLLFYSSPVLYYAQGPHSRVPEQYVGYYMLNPLACLLESYHDCVVRGRAPDAQNVLYVAAFAFVVLLIGYSIFNRGEGKFAKYV